jgi:ATP-dependent Clp protease ATP-binding subunit ClpA
VEKVISRMAKVPVQRVSSSDRTRLAGVDEGLKRLIFGQDQAIEVLAKAIRRSRAGLSPVGKTTGNFLLAGPTGVGKTELAKQLANVLGVHFMRYDMSEYMEKHAVARLIGAPPGYVGFEQGGLLTDGIRKHPFCVLLLDEIEKAHPDMFNILLQVMDYATLTDNNGRKADFSHVILLMTSNAGAREMSANTIGFGQNAGQDNCGKSHKAIEKLFSPEFRNRLDAIVDFKSLTPEIMEMIVGKYVAELNTQLRERKVTVDLTDQAVAWLAEKGHDPLYGARPLSRLVQEKIKDPLADELLFGKLQRGGTVLVGLAAKPAKKGKGLSGKVDPEFVFDVKGRMPAKEAQDA